MDLSTFFNLFRSNPQFVDHVSGLLAQQHSAPVFEDAALGPGDVMSSLSDIPGAPFVGSGTAAASSGVPGLGAGGLGMLMSLGQGLMKNSQQPAPTAPRSVNVGGVAPTQSVFNPLMNAAPPTLGSLVRGR